MSLETTCIGYDRPSHEAQSVNDYSLCASCDSKLEDAIIPEIHTRDMKCNCGDHDHGSLPYDCFCCFGD